MIIGLVRRPCMVSGLPPQLFRLPVISFPHNRFFSHDGTIWDPREFEAVLRGKSRGRRHPSSLSSPLGYQSSYEPLPDSEVVQPSSEWTAPKEPPLSSEQAALVDLVLRGRNVFYTGAAGTGKSRVLREFVDKLRLRGKNVQVVAPTGRAALAVGGTTTWSYMGWTPASMARPLDELCRRAADHRPTRMRLVDTDVLVIDEVSMVESHHLHRMNEVMKLARWEHAAQESQQFRRRHWAKAETQAEAERIRNSAFGKCQIVVTGDFCQLPPVLPFKHCVKCGNELQVREPSYRDAMRGNRTTLYTCPSGHGTWRDDDKWAFRSEAWHEANFEHVELRQVHRQAGDPRFISILNKVRMGQAPSREDRVLLTGREQELVRKVGGRDEKYGGRDPPDETAVRLFSTRAEVNEFNGRKFNALKTEPKHFPAMDEFIWNIDEHPWLMKLHNRKEDGSLLAITDDHFEQNIRLKIGMPVVLLSNLDLPAGLVNGSQGVICGWEPAGLKEPPKPRGSEKTESEYITSVKSQQTKAYRERRGVEAWPVVHFSRDNSKRVIGPECFVQEMGNEGLVARPGDKLPMPSLLCRTQIPLMAAWAMTIHKAQGMTLGKVVVDLSRAFAEGQVYVALSRATSLEGLKVEGDLRGLTVGLGGNKEVRDFYRKHFGAAVAEEDKYSESYRRKLKDWEDWPVAAIGAA